MSLIDALKGSEFANQWILDPKMIYLNHGSFGATPSAILEKQSEYRERLESGPVRFLIRQMEEMFELSRIKAANFVHASPHDLVFVQNATTAVSTVFRSLHFNPGDEILITNHTYAACRRLVEFICEQSGAHLIEACYDFPINSPDVILEAVLSKVTSRTKIALIDHITSATAIIQPVAAIVKELERKGVDAFIDGAHAPGSIPLDLENIGAAYYTGNCHKWICTPKSTALLHVRRDKQDQIHPLVISHAGHKAQPFTERFYWPGTFDPTPALCVGDAIDYLAAFFPGGWPELMQRNHDLCLEARNLLCQQLNIEKPCPDSMIASMATLPLTPPETIVFTDYKGVDPFQDRIFREFNMEIPVWCSPNPPTRLIRISVQLYNSLEQYRYLGTVLKQLLKSETA
ncbi:MAG: aminotransferase class V-fold PLP-dependent enzyme [Bacteroidales bacterium]|nr:aminotransferase class V-fold PLP-dependent enzyme [Bacteroidales bacterium]